MRSLLSLTRLFSRGQALKTYISSNGSNVPSSGLSHLDSKGKASMVDVAEKDVTLRKATASAVVVVGSEIFRLLEENALKKGDGLTVSQLAGMMGAKKTSDLIPLCHPIQLSHVDVQLHLDAKNKAVNIVCSAIATSRTGVEMEALTGASIAALTLYDMTKSVSHDIKITDLQLIEKTGGKRDINKSV